VSSNPDNDFSLSDEDFKKIVDLLNEHQPTCTICKKKNYIIHRNLISLSPVKSNTNIIFGGAGTLYPFAMVSCKHCGNTNFLNSVIFELSHPPHWKKDTIDE
jgi:predicted nucleic-acid-binding Zn-ribbon protein